MNWQELKSLAAERGCKYGADITHIVGLKSELGKLDIFPTLPWYIFLAANHETLLKRVSKLNEVQKLQFTNAIRIDEILLALFCLAPVILSLLPQTSKIYHTVNATLHMLLLGSSFTQMLMSRRLLLLN